MTLLLLSSCGGVSIDGEVEDPRTGSDSGPALTDTADTARPGDSGTDSGDSGSPEDTGEQSCEALPGYPLAYTSTGGWSGAEDFTFDGEGYLVSVDNGSLTRRNRDGATVIVRPGLGSTAGISMLPDGTAAYSDVGAGAVNRVSLEDGGYETLLGGLAYPNGIDTDADGWVYVAEHSGGRVHRVHAESQQSEILATGMTAPNGIAFGPDEQTLYWGSFGAGSIHAVDREGEGFGEPYLFGYTPDSQAYWANVIDPCAGLSDGEGCTSSSGGLGVCTTIGEQLACELLDTTLACEGLAAGDACSQELLGERVESACVETGPPIAPTLSCAAVPAEELEACEGLSEGEACEGGSCLESWTGALLCGDLDEEAELALSACAKAEEHQPCTVESDVTPYAGVCRSSPEGLRCQQKSSGYGSHGGLDGLNVDRCGNVYATEYVYGDIYRIGPEGGVGELLVELPTSWIPNLHWGDGVGGWEEDVLYVMDRNYGGGGAGAQLYELAVEIEGAEQAFQP